MKRAADATALFLFGYLASAFGGWWGLAIGVDIGIAIAIMATMNGGDE